jgi:O-acetyl-ADP-ribose deacetylase (regulator of RNase III)
MALEQRSIPISPRITLRVVSGDLTDYPADAIVNAANSRLQHGGGLAGALVRKGGQSIQQQSDRWVAKNGLVQHGKPAVTSAGALPASFIIHAVGPVWGEGDEDRKLADAVTGSLEAAQSLSARSIAFPAISTGIYRFPVDQAARVILAAIHRYAVTARGGSLQTVDIVLMDHPTLQAFVTAFDDHFKIQP